MVHKSQLDEWLRVVDSGLTLLVLIVQLQENRTYMLLTNRLVPLVELLLWCLNRPTKSVYSLSCVPQLFYLLNRHLRHTLPVNAPPQHRYFQNQWVEYIFSCPLVLKLKQKFLSFNGGLDLSTAMGKVPLALLKSIAFLETLTNYNGFTAHNKAVYEKKQFM